MIFKQPKPFYLIFSLELWERFGFYGLQAIITTYLIKKMSLSETESITLFSSFIAIVYGFVSIGGWLGDKILGIKRTMKLGIFILILGYTIMSFSEKNIKLVYLALSTIAVGNCIFKVNPSSLLSLCYKNKKNEIDTAFTIYYMSINIGSLLSMLLTPWLVHKYNWGIAFSASVLGLLITLINFIYFQQIIKKLGSKPDFLPITKKKIILITIGIVTSIFITNWLLQTEHITNKLLELTILITSCIFIKKFIKLNTIEKKKMIVVLILIIEATIFFTLYNQMPTSLNFFAIRNVKHNILNLNIEPEQYQSLNPFWIIIFSPILAKMYNKIGDKKLPITHKFTIGMILCTISFLILPLGIILDTNKEGLISAYWLILSYAFQSLGELMISGLGLSMIAQLVPEKLTGFSMGFWYLTTSISSIISGKIANLMSFPKSININTFKSLNIYKNVFFNIGIFSGIITIIVIIITPFLYSIIKEKNITKIKKMKNNKIIK